MHSTLSLPPKKSFPENGFCACYHRIFFISSSYGLTAPPIEHIVSELRQFLSPYDVVVVVVVVVVIIFKVNFE